MNLNSNTTCAWNAVTMTGKKSLKRLEDGGNYFRQALNTCLFFLLGNGDFGLVSTAVDEFNSIFINYFFFARPKKK